MSLISWKFATELDEKEMRDAYLSAQTRTHLSYQIRTIRSQRGWSQEEFAEKMNTSQSAVSRMEDRQYGKQNLQTLIEVASTFDCGLLVQFVPYDEFIRKTSDLSQEALEIGSFNSASLLPLTEELPTVDVEPDFSTAWQNRIGYTEIAKIPLGPITGELVNNLAPQSLLTLATPMKWNLFRMVAGPIYLESIQPNTVSTTSVSEVETENELLRAENARLKAENERLSCARAAIFVVNQQAPSF
jgi:transcriptional regulator with XRE-family HTH domain